MGDFNHGPTVATPPDVSEIIYDYPIHYGVVNAGGYFSPYVLLDGRCTFCIENEKVSTPSRIVDHIYVPVTSTQRVIGAEVRTGELAVTGMQQPFQNIRDNL